MATASQSDLTTGAIPDHFRRLAVPTAIGMVFTTLYNVVDVFYAGMLSTDAQAGLAIGFQVFFMLIVASFGMSAAMSALVGNALGRGDGEAARANAVHGIGFAVLISALFIAIGQLATPFLIGLISEPGGYRDAATGYLRLLVWGVPIFVLAHTANGILTAQGDTNTMKQAHIGAFFANLVLNPLLIFGVPGLWNGMGFNGLAASTLLGQAGATIWVLRKALRSEVMQGGARDFRPDWPRYGEIFAQALPVSFAMMVMMFAGYVIQYFLKGFGGEAVAAYGIALRIEQLLLLPAFGLTGALLPIVAQNYGAEKFDRIREAVRYCFRTGVALMLCASAVLWLAGKTAMGVFTDDPEVTRIGASYLAVDGFVLPIYLMLFGINSLLQAFKKAVWTLWIGIYRQGFGVAFFSVIFVRIFDLGVWGVWFGIAVSVLTGFLVSLVIAERISRQLIGGLFLPLPSGQAGAAG